MFQLTEIGAVHWLLAMHCDGYGGIEHLDEDAASGGPLPHLVDLLGLLHGVWQH